MKEYHEYLKENDTIEFVSTVQSICDALGISESTFYRKLNQPQKLSKAEKNAIASIYKMPAHWIFPELENVA
jgi:hypothetical protein